MRYFWQHVGRTFLLLATLWISIGTLAAQSPEQRPDGDTLSGCLRRVDNEYMLTDDQGAAHRLVGPNKKLSHELEHEVEVTGKPGTRTYDTTQPGGASSAIERQVFVVKTIKHVADFCR